MGTAQSSREKFGWFKIRFELMKRNDQSFDEKKLIAQFCLEFASTPRRAKEIIKLFETAGEIKRIGGEIATPDKIKRELGISTETQTSVA